LHATFSQIHKKPDGVGVLIALFCGYFIGLVAQPASSRIRILLYNIIAKANGVDKHYVEMIQKELDDRESMILSKMVGENTFFVQCAVLGFVLLLIRLLYPQVHWTRGSYVIHACICVLFLIEAIEFADRRFKRARDKKEVKNTEPTIS
jgi:hypothetical protein